MTMAAWCKDGGAMMALVAAMALAVPAAAQVAGGGAPAAPTPTPTPTAPPVPTPSATALPVPPAPVIVLPSTSPMPSPRPSATSAVRATPTARATPTPRAKVSPSPAPRVDPSPSPAATPLVIPAPVIAAPATPTPAPIPTSSPAPAPAPAATTGGDFLGAWPVAPIVGVAALLALGWVLLRRRRAGRDEIDDAPVVAPAPAEPFAPPAPIARARLAMTLRPIRAGLNLLSALCENEIVLANVGDAPAEDIRLLTQLASAHTGQDADLAAIYAAPIGRPSVPAFALAPGEERAVTSIAALPRDAIRVLTAAGRPMFVPIVAVNVLYASGAGEGQLAQAYAIGVERVDSAKLAPFWLDAAPRMVDQVAARPHAAALER